MLDKLCTRHGIPRGDVRLPGPNELAHNPPEGFTTFNRYACPNGAIPPLNVFLRKVLNFLGIAPAQLHPNAYGQLNALYVVFRE